MSGMSFVFVAHGGELEVKAALLAASLARNVVGLHELVAAVPEPASIWGELSEATRSLFDRLDVKQRTIRNGIDPSYPIGNKITAIGVPCAYERVVFLDSDMMLVQPLLDHFDLTPPFAAKPADVNTYAHSGGRWRKVYGHFGLALPSERVQATVSREQMLPYFNAGFIATRRNQQFSECWLDTARVIDRHLEHPRLRRWLDQTALPIAVARLGERVFCLSERFNFPAHKESVSAKQAVYFAHYHSPDVIRESALLNAEVGELLAGNPELSSILGGHAAWQALAQEPNAATRMPG